MNYTVLLNLVAVAVLLATTAGVWWLVARYRRSLAQLSDRRQDTQGAPTERTFAVAPTAVAILTGVLTHHAPTSPLARELLACKPEGRSTEAGVARWVADVGAAVTTDPTDPTDPAGPGADPDLARDVIAALNAHT